MLEVCINAARDRLVPSPIFILSSIRSGSTLLRCVLNSHTDLHAPHELHLTDLHVITDQHNAKLALRKMELDSTELENLLWDRILYRQLSLSGKAQIVEKT